MILPSSLEFDKCNCDKYCLKLSLYSIFGNEKIVLDILQDSRLHLSLNFILENSVSLISVSSKFTLIIRQLPNIELCILDLQNIKFIMCALLKATLENEQFWKSVFFTVVVFNKQESICTLLKVHSNI